MAYRERLLDRQSTTGRPVRVGLVGAGQMGRGFVAQVRKIAGMEVVAVADIDVQRATSALKAAGIENVVTGDDHDKLTSVVADGGTVAVNDSSLLTALPVDMVIDATGVPEIGAQIALRGLLSGKHVGLLNVETDITVGWLLSRIAAQSGAVYTLCRGDEPAETLKLVEFARDLAFDVVCAGKGKNNPLRPHDTPTSLTAEANSKKMNPKMLCSFVDGSKAMIEMAALANAADLGVSKRGMSGYETTVPELHNVFKPSADGGILDRSGVVDFATGPVAPGVFVVARSDEHTVIEEMDYLGMGAGPVLLLLPPLPPGQHRGAAVHPGRGARRDQRHPPARLARRGRRRHEAGAQGGRDHRRHRRRVRLRHDRQCRDGPGGEPRARSGCSPGPG